MKPLSLPIVGLVGVSLVVASYDEKVDVPPASAVGHLAVAVSTSSASWVTAVPNAIVEAVYDTWTGRSAVGSMTVMLP